jgi:uncharacterized membrane protein HdeD (DUF308 family)
MELKYYDKPWLPAIKGAFLIIFGIMAMLRIVGTIKSLAVLFAFLIAMIGILLIATGIMSKKSSFRGWTIVSGAINLAFCIYLAMHVDTVKSLSEVRDKVLTFIVVWVSFYAVTELVEAGLLLYKKNAYSAVFVITGLLSLTFGYFLNVVSLNFTPQAVFNIGLIALVIGIVNELCSYLLSRVKE